MTVDADWLAPAWRIAGVGARMTTRAGGTSAGPYASMNVGDAVGDRPENVAANRARLAEAIGARPVFLRQVHGARVVTVGAADARVDAPWLEADAAVTSERGVACVVQAADCLPVLLAAPHGRAVGAAHAGWRGLAGGVVEAAVAAVCAAGDCAPHELSAWLGACIGPDAFEVGADVLVAFGVAPDARGEGVTVVVGDQDAPGRSRDAFAAPSTRFRARGDGKWLADLAGLARDRLVACGVRAVDGGQWCTVRTPKRFFSYRRDRVTGRMAAAIWRERV